MIVWQTSLGLTTQLVYSVIIQWLIYGNHPNIITSIGIVLIVVTGLVAAVGRSLGNESEPAALT